MNSRSMEIFTLVKCTDCSFIYLNPRPDEKSVEHYYAQEGYDPFIVFLKPRNWMERIYKFIRPYSIRWKRGVIEKISAPGTLLDIGCGTGEFLFEMKRAKWDVVGIEPDKRARNFSREEYGLAVYSNFDEFFRNRSMEFAIVTMWHSLEHIHRLNEVLDILGKIVKRGGFILVAVPNILSFDFFVYRESWVALDLPRHLYHFTPMTIEKLFAKYGFLLCKSRHIPLDLFYNILMSEKLVSSVDRGDSDSSFNLLRLFSTILISYAFGVNLLFKREMISGSGMLYQFKR